MSEYIKNKEIRIFVFKSDVCIDKGKMQVGKDQEKAHSEKKIPTPKTKVGKKLN